MDSFTPGSFTGGGRLRGLADSLEWTCGPTGHHCQCWPIGWCLDATTSSEECHLKLEPSSGSAAAILFPGGRPTAMWWRGCAWSNPMHFLWWRSGWLAMSLMGRSFAGELASAVPTWQICCPWGILGCHHWVDLRCGATTGQSENPERPWIRFSFGIRCWISVSFFSARVHSFESSELSFPKAHCGTRVQICAGCN